MPKYVILNTIKNDGVGDFSHFEDIVQAIKANSKFDDVELFVMVLFQENLDRYRNCNLYLELFRRTHNLGCQYVFGTIEEHRYEINVNSYIKSQLINAAQILVIAYDKLFEFYEPYFNPKAVIKYIPEHDALMSNQKVVNYPPHKVKYPRELLMRGMGLSPNCYGIKIKRGVNFTYATAVENVQKSDPYLFSSMINCVGAKDLAELLRDNIIIPAYFSYSYKFAEFIAVVSKNFTIHRGKNIIIYHSGTDFNNFKSDVRYKYLIKNTLRHHTNCHIQVYSPSSNTPNIEFKNENESVIYIRVFSGFNISYSSYQALYKLAPLVGVSGDNTFELAVKSNVLPIYWSTNAAFKEQTFSGLQNIVTNHDLGLNKKIVRSFLKFFELCKDGGVDFHLFANINFVELCQNWPVIARHIKAHYNFYDKLENIICEKLPSDALPLQLRPQISRVSQFSSWLGFFTRIFDIGIREGNPQREISRVC